MVSVGAKVKLHGRKGSYSSTALVDTGARMSLVDKSTAEHIGVEYTGRKLDFISISGHVVEASEAVVLELVLEGELLKYEAIAVVDMPENVKEVLREAGFDENLVIGILTLERANMMPDTTTGALKKARGFLFHSGISRA